MKIFVTIVFTHFGSGEIPVIRAEECPIAAGIMIGEILEVMLCAFWVLKIVGPYSVSRPTIRGIGIRHSEVGVNEIDGSTKGLHGGGGQDVSERYH